jgi:RNA polymerase sigma-70 factor (ECF subfamily)
MAEDVFRLLLQHRFELYAFIRAAVHNDADAEDLFQEVASVVVKNAAELPKVRDFRSWTREIARRTLLHHLRRKRTAAVPVPSEEIVELLADVAAEHAPAPAAAQEELEAMRACLERMPERLRRLLHLRFVADESYEEIARMVASSSAAVRRAAARARLALLGCTERRLRRASQGA